MQASAPTKKPKVPTTIRLSAIPEEPETIEQPETVEKPKIGDPNRFFMHTKHVLNRVDEAVFVSPVLCRPDPQNFGALYHFPPLEKPARLAGQPLREPEQVVASVLAKARKPATRPSRPDPSPPCIALHSKPQPLLVISGDGSKWFQVLRECLTLSENILVSRLNHRMRKLTLENTEYWQKQFKLLFLGPHIFVPLFSNAILRRWVKVLYIQQVIAHHKRQLDLDLVTAHKLENPVREPTVNALTLQYNSRIHQCGLCNADVPYSLHLDNGHKKVVDIVQMACPPCFSTKLWTSKEAAILWGVTGTKQKDVAWWRLPTVLHCTTADLYEAWVQMDLSKRELDPQLITRELAERYKDLPPLVQKNVALHESKDGIPPEFDLEKGLSLFREGDLDEPTPDAKKSELPGALPRVFHGGSVFWLSYTKRTELPLSPADLKKEYHDAPAIQLLPETVFPLVVSLTDYPKRTDASEAGDAKSVRGLRS